jgi:hypothetical protein
MLATISVSIVFNTLLARKLPLVEGLFIFCHILGVLIFIVFWMLLPTRIGGGPLVEFYNGGGWSSNGLATMVGTVGPITSLIGFDCSIHMCMSILEPILLLLTRSPHSGRGKGFLSQCTVHATFWICRQCCPRILRHGHNVSRVCSGARSINIHSIYTIGPLETSLNPASGYPILDMFLAATHNLAATNVMTAVLLINFIAAAIAALAAASRQFWAFARNDGLPYSRLFAPVRAPFPAKSFPSQLTSIGTSSIRYPSEFNSVLPHSASSNRLHQYS